jgi:hypothetical protein
MLPASASAKIPPKFVPTLTEVVQLPGGGKLVAPSRLMSALATQSGNLAGPAEAAELSELVHTMPAELEPSAAVHGENLGDLLIHRVMQRVDENLARDLRVAVAQLVVTHVQSLTPLLRTEIDRVVRASVEAALAKEFGATD